MTAHDLDALLDVALAAARAAGDELLRRAGDVHDVQTKSSATDPVSEADRAAEEVLVGSIRSHRPDDGLLGEEGASAQGTTGLRWVIDPLDGTVNYLYRFPAWGVSVACEDRQSALVGVVHDPVKGETFAARRGGGAWLEGRRLRVNDPVTLDRALVATGFGYDPERRRAQGRTLARVVPEVRDVRRAGSAALDLCAVAAGRVDGYYETGTSHWDWAAGALIAAEAGAVVRHYAEDGLVVAGAALIGPLEGLVVAT